MLLATMNNRSLKIASYNVLCGERGAIRDYANMLKPYSFDIIGFCEAPADGWTAEVGNFLDMPYSYTGSISTAGHKDKYKSILSRHPIASAVEHPIQNSRWKEHCSAVRAEIQINAQTISFYSLHIPRNPTKDQSGVDDLAGRIFAGDGSEIFIAVGDYNAPLEHDAISYLAAKGYRSAWSDLHAMRIPLSTMEHESAGVIDHALYRSASPIQCLDGGIIDYTPALSDHFCVWFEFYI